MLLIFLVFYIVISISILYKINNETTLYYKIEKHKKSIIWNKKNEINQLINETVDMVNYTYNKIHFKFFIRKNDFISNTIRKRHYWVDCITVYGIWKKYNLWNYSYLIDVGANIGSCSVFMLHSHVKVISFEPIKNNLHLFSKSMLVNRKYMNNFTLFMTGLSDKSTEKIIYINPSNWGASSIFRQTNYLEKIYIMRLDDINIHIKEKIGMLKIDIECSELNMIKGGIKFIKEHYIKIIYFEQLCVCNKYYKSEKYDIYAILESLNYNILNKLNCSMKKFTDIIAVRKD